MGHLLLDEAYIPGGGRVGQMPSPRGGRRGDRLYCSINSYNIWEG